MSELQKGHTYNPSDTVDYADLNALVDSGTALKGLIADQPLKLTPIGIDGLLIYDSVTNDLARTAIGSLPVVKSVVMVMPTSEFTVTNSTVSGAATLTAAWKNQPGNKFFAGNGTGAGLTPTFRQIAAEDISLASVEILASNVVDWSLGFLFHKILTATGTTTFNFTNVQDGQTIKVMIGQDGTGGRNASFGSHIWWRGSAYPVQQGIPNHVDIWEFTAYGGAILGKADGNYGVID